LRDYEIPFPAYDPKKSYVVRPLEYGNEARFINDYRYHGCRRRRANVELRQAWSRHVGACFIGVFASSNIRVGEELLMDYGTQYWRVQQRKRHLELPRAVITIPSEDEAGQYLAAEVEGGNTVSRTMSLENKRKGERREQRERGELVTDTAEDRDERKAVDSSSGMSDACDSRKNGLNLGSSSSTAALPLRGGILEGFGTEVIGSGDQTPVYTPKQQEKIQRLKEFTGIKDDGHAAILLQDEKWDINKAMNYFYSQEEFFLNSENNAKMDQVLLEDVKAKSMEDKTRGQ